MSKTLSPAVRRIIVHCVEWGGLQAGDSVKAHPMTVEQMVKRGYLALGDEEGTYVLTPEGRAAYPWPEPTRRNAR